MRITWTCWLHPFSSMGIIAINVIKELSKLGIDVGFNVLNQNEIFIQDYPLEVQKAIEKGYREDSIGIFFSYPDSYNLARCKINIGYTGADTSLWYRSEGIKQPYQMCNEYTDYMLTPSIYSKKIMEKCGVTKKIGIFPHGVDKDLFFPRTKNKKELPFTFLYIGEISLRKGSHDLITSFIEKYGNNLDYRLILRGNTHMMYYGSDEIKKLCYDIKNIELIWINEGQKDVSNFFKKAHAYVYPSRADWFGMTPFEAMASGLPVIATKNNGYYEFLSDKLYEIDYEEIDVNNNHPYLKGTWFKPINESIKKAMEEVYEKYDIEEEERKRNAYYIRENFSWESVVKKYLLPFLKEIDKKHFEKGGIKMDNKKKDNRVTVGILFKDRPVELSLLLQSLLNQSYKDFDLIIVNDSYTDVLETNSTIQALLKILQSSDSKIKIIKGPQKGPQYGGQILLENSETELILRLDDDVSLRPFFIEELVKMFDDPNVGAAGPIYLDPHSSINDHIIPELSNEEMKKISSIYWDENGNLFLSGFLQSVLHKKDDPIETQHLNSGFMYRKSAGLKIGGYFLDLSLVGHREETDFSYRIYREGYKLLICPKAIAFHFHPMYGGIRETEGEMLRKENWDLDEKKFLSRVEKWIPKNKEMISKKLTSVIILTHGNHENLRLLLGDIDNYTNHPCEILIINNDTNHESVEDCKKIKTEFSNINELRIINLPKILSVSEARNFGVEKSNKESKFICFIDDDARILGRFDQISDWLGYLYNKFNEQPDVGAVGAIKTWFDDLKAHVLSISCLFTSKKVWSIVGKLDPVFGSKEKGTWGYEDVDWSYRAFLKGFKLIGPSGSEFPFYHEDTTYKEKPLWYINGLKKSKEILLSKYNLNEINDYNRTIYPFTKDQMDIKGIKLNVGCYYMYINDFINIDIKNNIGADLVCDARELENHFAPESVNLILASHMLEHIPYNDAKKVLLSWKKILSKNGVLIIEVPDCENLEERLKNGHLSIDSYNVCKYGFPDDFGQKHEYEYTRSILKNLLEYTGFINIIENKNTSLNVNYNEYSQSFRFDCMKG